MVIPYTGLFFAARCNSRSSHCQYTRSSTEHFQYGTVTSARLQGHNYRNENFSKVRSYVLSHGQASVKQGVNIPVPSADPDDGRL
jgi:hypothetical protein